MIWTIIICSIACVSLILLVAFKPSIKVKTITLDLYPIAPLLAALILLCIKAITLTELWDGLTQDTAINPLKILVLFISMTIISVYLDELGFFRFLANKTLEKAKTSQMRLFCLFYLVVSILTIFTSNDIIILTFTPFICYFSKNAKINPIPYLVAEFVAANTWSMMLIIGNPTNIYLAGSNNISFIEYLKMMIIPTLLSGVSAFLLLFILFHKRLLEPIWADVEEVILEKKPLLIIGITHLCACIIVLAISSYINLEMWLICLGFAVSLITFTLIYSAIKREAPRALGNSIRRSPWSLIPFVLSMFVLVLSLEKEGITEKIASFFSKGAAVFNFGLTSFLTCNLINNIPMSVLFSAICANIQNENTIGAVYASIIGSNIGAFLTPIGALAGIMWTGLIKTAKIKFTFFDFIKYGELISIPTLLVAIGGLYISLAIF